MDVFSGTRQCRCPVSPKYLRVDTYTALTFHQLCLLRGSDAWNPACAAGANIKTPQQRGGRIESGPRILARRSRSGPTCFGASTNPTNTVPDYAVNGWTRYDYGPNVTGIQCCSLPILSPELNQNEDVKHHFSNEIQAKLRKPIRPSLVCLSDPYLVRSCIRMVKATFLGQLLSYPGS